MGILIVVAGFKIFFHDDFNDMMITFEIRWGQSLHSLMMRAIQNSVRWVLLSVYLEN